MATFGTVGVFDGSVEPWSHYTERLEQFFQANDITDENRKRAIFLTVVGPATYGLLKDLISPALPSTRTLQQLVDTLNGHFDPVPSEIVERFKFNSRVRKAGESVATFIAELRRLAKHCNYGATLDTMLRDRIVCGIQDDAMQRKLLAENGLTLARATEIAISMEAAARNAGDLKSAGTTTAEMFAMQQKAGFSKRSNAPETKSANFKCLRCGSQQHKSADCKFITATCNSCSKIGHIARVCLSKGKITGKASKKTGGKVHQLQQLDKVEVEAPEQYELFNLAVMGEAPPPTRVLCHIQGQEICMEIDSGAPFSLIPESTYIKHKQFFPKLQETDVKLQTYTKQSIDIVGVMEVTVSFRDKIALLPLLVVKQGSVNLAGRNWISPLALLSAFQEPSTDKLPVCKLLASDESLKMVLGRHQQIFSEGLGLVKGVKVHLNCHKEAQSKFFKARPVPYAYRDKVNNEIDRLVADGILEPIKTSVWAAPIVPVLKRDGRVRICGDFKLTVNKVTELEQYPLPKVEDLFAQLAGGASFTKLDLKDAYCQLELDEESKQLVVINTQKGLFRYTRLPFGVASAPAIFQREMDKLLQGVTGASCYLDDLLVTGRDEREHLQNLHEVLSRLQVAGIKLHAGKCEFLRPSVEYLGHRIDKDGLHPVESKLRAITEAPNPTNVDELRSFLGLVTYYAKFLPNMATLLAPLYRLLENKQTWKWKSPEETAFREIKKVLNNSSLLVHFDKDKEVILACDASPYGLGAVLSHKTSGGDRPIAFASRSLTKAERNYSHIEKETLALVFGVTKFRNYLLGRRFTLLTDHRPLVSLLSEDKPVPTMAAARIQRWALILSAYAYRIEFRKGILNSNADACSRLPLPTKEAEVPVPAETVLLLEQIDDSPITAYHIAEEIGRNPDLQKIRGFILHGWPKDCPLSLQKFRSIQKELSVERSLIFRGSRIYIPDKFQRFVLDELHEGHPGISAIKALARSSVWWPGIDADLEATVKKCQTCQENASMPSAKNFPWPVPKGPWQRIHIDHAGPVENQILLIVVDAGSKWLEAIPVSSLSSAATIAALRSLFSRFGLPSSLVSDNGTAFSSSEFRHFMAVNGITHIRTAPYHPKSNGIAERAVRTVKSALKKAQHGTLQCRLDNFLFMHRRTPLAATGVSPAMAMFGRPLRSRLDLLKEGKVHKYSSNATGLKTGDEVWARNFVQGPKWVPGTIMETKGKSMVSVNTSRGEVSRHLDQIRKRVERTSISTPPITRDIPASQDYQRSYTPTELTHPVPDSPPVLLPEPPVQISDNCSSEPPVLTPCVERQLASKTTTPVRRSMRARQTPKRLGF